MARFLTRRKEGGSPIQWDHDGVNVTSFGVSVDGTEYAVGLPTPVGTTYTATLPVTLSGTYDVIVYAYNGANRVGSVSVEVTW